VEGRHLLRAIGASYLVEVRRLLESSIFNNGEPEQHHPCGESPF
jgi:hypothetical protein